MTTMIWLMTGVMLISAAGCGPVAGAKNMIRKNAAPAKDTVQAKPGAGADQEVRLAQMILAPKRKVLSVTSDPFKPLLIDGLPVLVAGGEAGMETGTAAGVEYLGMIKMAEVSSVLVKTAKGKCVYQLNDAIDQCVLNGINTDFISLMCNGKTVQLKRGAT